MIVTGRLITKSFGFIMLIWLCLTYWVSYQSVGAQKTALKSKITAARLKSELVETKQELQKQKNKPEKVKVKIIEKKVPVKVLIQAPVKKPRTQIVKSSGSQKAAMALPRQDNINYCELYRIKISPCPYRSRSEAEAYLQGLNKNKKPAMRDYLY